MARARGFGARIVVLTAGVVGTMAAGVRAAEPDRVLEAGVLTYAAFDASEVQIARETAQALLASAGIHIAWRGCEGNGSCEESSAGRPFVRVQLLPLTKSADPTATGDAVRTSSGPMTALVYVPRNAEIAQTLRRTSDGRSHPSLSTLTDRARRRPDDRARDRPSAGAVSQAGRRDEAAAQRRRPDRRAPVHPGLPAGRARSNASGHPESRSSHQRGPRPGGYTRSRTWRRSRSADRRGRGSRGPSAGCLAASQASRRVSIAPACRRRNDDNRRCYLHRTDVRLV